MSEVKHTPEPWVVYKADEGIAYGIDSERKKTVLYYKSKSDPQFTGLDGESELANANAERIVACVNHCKGATNEELEAISYEQMNERFNELKAQRDESMEALELAQQIILDQKAGFKHEREKISWAIVNAKGGQQ